MNYNPVSRRYGAAAAKWANHLSPKGSKFRIPDLRNTGGRRQLAVTPLSNTNDLWHSNF